ncbi:hypothetical protein OSB04_005251 [Centaurea solstitialis]|uniref:RING-type E3 ubiquitin transferase n=1 Tax=Centaurea solstitialis TaxID=347529 RepID=A0AA38WS01_9ASTR|nr:hypothetical protein OSB04_005251 [Centaurea solstitialis]
MQGQRGVIGSFQETLGFDHGSGSSDGDQQICWETNLQNSQSNGSDLFLESINQEGQGISMWTMGEAGSSSGSNQASHGPIEPRPDGVWPGLMKSRPEPPAGLLQLGDHGSLVPHNVTANPLETYRGSNAASSSSFSDPFGPSSDPFETDNRRLSRKRKAVELSVGQSSSGNVSEGGSNLWQTIAENPSSDNPIIPRLGLGVSGIPFENPVAGNARRNVQLRISSSRQQDPLPASNSNNNRQSDISALYPSLRLNPVDFRSLPAPVTTENPNSISHRGQPGLRIPALRRNLQSNSRWSRNSSSRTNRSSNLVIPAERNEIDSRTIPSNISDHPLFAQPTEINWGLHGGVGTVSNGGNGVAAAASSQAAAAPLSAPPSSSAHRNPPHYYPRRLSAFLRRSLLSATDLEAAGGLNGNLFARIPPSASSSSQDLGIPLPSAAVSVQNHHQQAQLRASSVLVGRQVEGTFGFPYLSRSMLAGSEGRGRLVSEIRNVLDLMRRGEPLRFEDIMILDQSVLYGIADVHDRHRDMRLDIDNMSYEELLALEERIGNVNTGLTEEKISKHLKQKQYVAVPGQPDAEPCCVCQEEYKNGDDLGTLECGHEFHHGCIKQWLQHKNSCPICKSTGFGGP